MTKAQENKVEFYKIEFQKNNEKYTSWSNGMCKFTVYKSDLPEDNNITLIYTIISGLSDFGEPFFQTSNILIEPDGNSLNLIDFFPSDEVLGYIQKLKKIN